MGYDGVWGSRMVLKIGFKKSTKKSRKNQFCIFEACGTVPGARVELSMANNVNYIHLK